jgi:small GTP-binding protein
LDTKIRESRTNGVSSRQPQKKEEGDAIMNSDINQFLGQSFEQSLGQPCRIVIIGRPNVGKSTLFNRLIGRKRALVHNLPGVTRDRLEEEGEWIVAGKNFSIVLTDTGGLKGDQFSEEISQQVDIALENADVVLFVFDGQTGLTPVDEELFLELQRSGIFKRIPILGVINKVDLEMHEHRISDFFSLGIESLLTVSAEHGRGMEDLKMAIAQTVGFFDPQNFSEIPTIAPNAHEYSVRRKQNDHQLGGRNHCRFCGFLGPPPGTAFCVH